MCSRKLTAIAILLALLTLGAAFAHASGGLAPADLFTLERAVVGAGGPRSVGAGFELDATAGQPVAGSALSPDAGLSAGFWGAPPPPPGHRGYLPLVLAG